MLKPNYKIFNNKNIFVTGGTGSFGSNFIKKLLKESKPKKLICFSRDELKQSKLQQDINKIYKQNCLRFFIGDVRDKERLNLALLNNDVDYVVHAAALKQVPTIEYNPFEAVKTNILGAQNIIETSIQNKIKKVIALSTDKASSPLNLYGATKLVSDKLFINANFFSRGHIGRSKEKKATIFSIVRYGNVIASRGSVIPYFKELNKSNKPFHITDKKMTRFSITLDEAINFTVNSFSKMIGGEIFVPKIPSYNIVDLVKAINNKPKIKIIGIRAGEKLHEEMISEHDSINTLEGKDHYVILPNTDSFDYNLSGYLRIKNNLEYKKINKFFSYNSKKNNNFLSISNLKKIIANN